MKRDKNIDFHYDKEVDVLYASIGKPKPAKSIEKGNGTIIRIDAITGEVVGFTVIHYMRRIKDGLLKEIPEFKNIKLPKY